MNALGPLLLFAGYAVVVPVFALTHPQFKKGRRNR